MMKPETAKPAFRLAMRAEGENWNAYYARPDTMEGALWIASIRLSLVQDQNRRQRFIDLLTDTLTSLLPGAVESWTQQQAPPSERSGSA